ncbi:AbrB/MazE/SpoVT family DNA-binding domain-containing protein [Frankia sp. Cr1]|uniref:AbrB/MazE/SpoVT family DNA-binding domain-containing protein n=1 Tax=Frankia sp. Cr1 TaxID=3073931 RepID=UPI002AD47036|nr:AbrB/MazE/SpoVT family DNA-binding domain-containing protein [Frankia sp. Cr1]
MRITSKGQVTIPVEIREKADLLPGSEIKIIFDDDGVHIVRVESGPGDGRGQRIVRRLRGTAPPGMSTDEIMAFTRDE